MGDQTININHLPLLSRAVANLARQEEARKAMEPVLRAWKQEREEREKEERD